MVWIVTVLIAIRSAAAVVYLRLPDKRMSVADDEFHHLPRSSGGC